MSVSFAFFLLLAPNKLWRLFYYTTPPSRNVSHVIFFQRCSFFLFLLLRFFNEADNVARLCLFFLLHPVVQHRSRFSNMKKTPAFLIGWPMRWRKAHLCFCLGWPTKIVTVLANHCCCLPFFFLLCPCAFLINGSVVRMELSPMAWLDIEQKIMLSTFVGAQPSIVNSMQAASCLRWNV